MFVDGFGLFKILIALAVAFVNGLPWRKHENLGIYIFAASSIKMVWKIIANII
ncbi:hypothetical protein D3C85_1779240 [compost metagenome]